MSNENIIIVGSGLAGLSATIEAYNTAKEIYDNDESIAKQHSFPKIYLIEKERSIGGNSAKATSGINGALTKYQKQAGVNDTLSAFAEDTFVSGGNINVPSLVNTLVHSSKDAVEWFSNFNLELSAISQCGGHSIPRTHRQAPRPDGKPSPVGWNIISTLKNHILEKLSENVSIMLNTKVDELVMDKSGNVIGVKYVTLPDKKANPEANSEITGEIKYLPAKAVILASGGYAHDWTETSLLRRFGSKSLQNVPTTNGPFATGDGVKMGTAIGAAVVDMDKIQIHPTGFIKLSDPFNPTKFLAPEALRGYGGILLNSQGKRFINELTTRDVVSNAIFRNCSDVNIKHFDAKQEKEIEKTMVRSWLIMNEQGAKAFDIGSINFYVKMGLVHIIQGLDKLSAFVNIPVDTLKATFEEYRMASVKGIDEFGKTRFPVVFSEDDVFYASAITPSIHYTMGGLAVNAVGEILCPRNKKVKVMEAPTTFIHQENMRPILSLYGAGEVTGGVHGKNRLAGNSLLECAVFGRKAGRRAAESVLYAVKASQSEEISGIPTDSFVSLTFREYNENDQCAYFNLKSTFNKLSTSQALAVQKVSEKDQEEEEEEEVFCSNHPDGQDFGVIKINMDQFKAETQAYIKSLAPGDKMQFKRIMKRKRDDVNEAN